MKKVCSKCLKEKEATPENFYFRQDSQKWFSACKACMKDSNKRRWCENKDKYNLVQQKYYRNNKSYFTSYRKQYDAENRDAIAVRKRKYYLENKSQFAERTKKYIQARRMSDPTFKLRMNVSRSIHKMLKTGKGGKSILNYLPYTMNDLRSHLEAQFEPWMNWSNWGLYNSLAWNDKDPGTWTWQIDHIVPHSEFKYESMIDPEFTKCWALSNLRPLSAKQNLLDGATGARHL
jgi:hypothetical protein